MELFVLSVFHVPRDFCSLTMMAKSSINNCFVKRFIYKVENLFWFSASLKTLVTVVGF